MSETVSAAALEVVLNGEARRFSEAPAHLAALVELLGCADKRVAVEHNGEIVPKSRYAATPLQNGDALEIVIAVGGG